MSLALVARQGDSWATLELDPESNLLNINPTDAGTGTTAAATTALNIIAPIIVKLGAGRLVSISMLGPGSIQINDAADLVSANQTNALVNLTTTGGHLFRTDLPVSNGIVISVISGQATISYQ
jgi:hypothetical protein